MKNLPAAIDSITLPQLKKELQELRAAIPMFASWLIPDLDRIVKRYSEILTWLIGLDMFNVLCRELFRSLPSIETNMRETLASGDWRPFNKAVIALQWDLDELIRMLG
jgi:hypothetical protein